MRLNQLMDEIPGPMGRIRPMLVVMKQTSFTDAEMAQTKMTPVAGGITVEAPSPSFGSITVTLEDSVAEALVQELETSQKINTSDMRQWGEAVIEQLKTKRES